MFLISALRLWSPMASKGRCTTTLTSARKRPRTSDMQRQSPSSPSPYKRSCIICINHPDGLSSCSRSGTAQLSSQFSRRNAAIRSVLPSGHGPRNLRNTFTLHAVFQTPPAYLVVQRPKKDSNGFLNSPGPSTKLSCFGFISQGTTRIHNAIYSIQPSPSLELIRDAVSYRPLRSPCHHPV